MKNVFTMVCLVAFAAATAEANSKKKALIDEISGQGYGMAGCGLGSIVFGPKQGMIQIVAATFNGLGGQTFAITSGTSNCVSDDDMKRAELFVEANRLALEDDISRGQGETLANLGAIIGCENGVNLGTELQKKFEQIFPSRSATSKAITETIYQTIESNRALSSACFEVG